MHNNYIFISIMQNTIQYKSSHTIVITVAKIRKVCFGTELMGFDFFFLSLFHNFLGK